MKHTQMIVAFVSLVGLSLLTGCSNVRPSAPGEDRKAALEEAREDTRQMARDTMQELYNSQPSAREAVEKAAGYAVFRNFGTKILVAGGGAGRGLAVNNSNQQEVFMRMVQVQAGLGFGVKRFRVVWVFETQAALDRFISNGFEFGGQATLAAKASGQGIGVAGAVSVSPGVWLYQITDTGLAAEVTVKGTRYFLDRELN